MDALSPAELKSLVVKRFKEAGNFGERSRRWAPRSPG
jgi:hypothetical protein